MRGAKGGLAAALMGVVAGLGVGAPAHAQQAGGLAFADNKVTVAWADLTTGKPVELCNGAGARSNDTRRVGVVLTGFAFTDGGKAQPPGNVLTVEPPAAGIPPGDCAALTIKRLLGASVDPGRYAGTLVVAAPGAGTARLEMTVSGPGNAPAALAGASDQLTLVVHNETPWDRHGQAHLLLKAPAASEATPDFGDKCTEAAKPKVCPFLGTLFHGSDRIKVSAAGPISVRDHIARLPIKLTMVGHAVADYEGSLKLPGADNPIKVKVTTKDAWWCAVVALIVGTALALLLQLGNGRWRPKLALERRKDEIEGKYHSSEHVPSHPDITMDDDKVDAYVEDVATAIEHYAGSAVLLATSSAAYKQIEAALTLAESDAKVFAQEGGLSKSLTALKKEIDAIRDLLAHKQVADSPALLERALAPLEPGALGVGDATERAKHADESARLLPTWRRLATRVFAQAVWLKALAASQPWSEGEDAEMLAGAGATLYATRQELFVATDASGLDRIASSARIEQSYGQLDYLGRKHGVPMPPADAAPGSFKADLRLLNYLAPAGPPLGAEALVERAWRLIADSARAVRLPSAQTRLLAFDIASLVFGVIVSIVAGLSSFYFKNSFGTLEDYLTVILIGVAAQVVAKAVLDGLSALVHDIAPESETKPATAVTAPA